MAKSSYPKLPNMVCELAQFSFSFLFFKSYLISTCFFFLFLRFYLFIFREGKGEKHQCVAASCMPCTGDLARNPGMCPRLEIEPGTLWFTGQYSIH